MICLWPQRSFQSIRDVPQPAPAPLAGGTEARLPGNCPRSSKKHWVDATIHRANQVTFMERARPQSCRTESRCHRRSSHTVQKLVSLIVSLRTASFAYSDVRQRGCCEISQGDDQVILRQLGKLLGSKKSTCHERMDGFHITRQLSDCRLTRCHLDKRLGIGNGRAGLQQVLSEGTNQLQHELRSAGRPIARQFLA